MAAKKYYWLKLKNDWFDSREVKKLRRIAGGDTYTIIYLKLLLLSLKNEGSLYYEGIEDSFAEELALDLNEDTENVMVTISYLEKCGLIEITSPNEYFMTDIPSSIGYESESAERVRRHRAKKTPACTETLQCNNEALQCNSNVTKCNSGVTKCNAEIEIEKEIEKDIYIKTSARSPGRQDSEPEADVAAIMLNDGTEWRPSQALFAEYVRLYPKVEVKQQFNEMRGWSLSNPEKRKTRRGVARFVNGWLSREQDSGGGNGANGGGGGNKFNRIQKNDYDMADIENKIMANNR
jgi:predicted phage replisome organizer